MNKTLQRSLLLLSLLGVYSQSIAATDSEPDYSGRYICNGNNSRVGSYEVTMALKKNKAGSNQEFAVYDITAQTENATSYYGQAIAIGNRVALTFRLLNGKAVRSSTGLATMRATTKHEWSFISRYFEPNDGGIHGTDDCKIEKVPVAHPN